MLNTKAQRRKVMHGKDAAHMDVLEFRPHMRRLRRMSLGVSAPSVQNPWVKIGARESWMVPSQDQLKLNEKMYKYRVGKGA